MKEPRIVYVRHVHSRDELEPGEHIAEGLRPSHHQRWTEIASTTEEAWRRGIERERTA